MYFLDFAFVRVCLRLRAFICVLGPSLESLKSVFVCVRLRLQTPPLLHPLLQHPELKHKICHFSSTLSFKDGMPERRHPAFKTTKFTRALTKCFNQGQVTSNNPDTSVPEQRFAHTFLLAKPSTPPLFLPTLTRNHSEMTP